jgi:hypothetical protein
VIFTIMYNLCSMILCIHSGMYSIFFLCQFVYKRLILLTIFELSVGLYEN